jgi:hypothetical protein
VQRRAQGTAKFEFPSPTFWGIGQQRQLIQPLLQLGGRFRHCLAGRGAVTGLAPVLDRFFSEPSFGVMLREKMYLCVMYHLLV